MIDRVDDQEVLHLSTLEILKMLLRQKTDVPEVKLMVEESEWTIPLLREHTHQHQGYTLENQLPVDTVEVEVVVVAAEVVEVEDPLHLTMAGEADTTLDQDHAHFPLVIIKSYIKLSTGRS